MEEVKFTHQITFDSLGPWQPQILDAIRGILKGARVDYVPLPFGRPGIVVHWDGFEGLTTDERKARVKEAIDTLGPGISDKVSISLTLTNEESEDLERDYSSLMKEASLENAPSPQLQLYAFVKREFDSVFTSWYNMIDEQLVVNGRLGDSEKTVSFSNRFAEVFDEYDKTTEKGIIQTVLPQVTRFRSPIVSVDLDNRKVIVVGMGEKPEILDVLPVGGQRC